MAQNTDMTSWFFENNFNGVPDDFFDDQSKGNNDAALGLFDLSSVPVEEDDDGEVEDWDAKFESVELPPSDALVSLESTFCAPALLEATKNPVLLNQLPKVVEVTDSGNSDSSKESCVIQISSPNSVSSSNSPPRHPVHPKITVPVKRRSKRLRTETPKPWWSRSPASHLFLQPDMQRILNPVKRKEKRKKEKEKKLSLLSGEENRKCTHCQATKTPQWREGPMGPKTLCNACGVRHRSGRLFPEYRPLASPTFVASLHSNSHKKVAELRKKAASVDAVRASADDSSLVLQENLCSS